MFRAFLLIISIMFVTYIFFIVSLCDWCLNAAHKILFVFLEIQKEWPHVEIVGIAIPIREVT